MTDIEDENNEMKNEVELSEADTAELEQYYRENFNRGIPDFILGLTPDLLGWAIGDLLISQGLVPNNKTIDGFIGKFEFNEEGVIPVAFYFKDAVGEVNKQLN